MKLSEAKRILGKMVLWSMITQGIEPDEKPEPITEDLQTLLTANRMVEKANERSRKRVEKLGKGSRSVSMTIADRGIAALYVAANFTGDNPDNADILAKHKDNLVFCLGQSRIK